MFLEETIKKDKLKYLASTFLLFCKKKGFGCDYDIHRIKQIDSYRAKSEQSIFNL